MPRVKPTDALTRNGKSVILTFSKSAPPNVYQTKTKYKQIRQIKMTKANRNFDSAKAIQGNAAYINISALIDQLGGLRKIPLPHCTAACKNTASSAIQAALREGKWLTWTPLHQTMYH